MKIKLLIFLLLSIKAVTGFAVGTGDKNTSGQVHRADAVITSISPTKAAAGEIIAIKGENFGNINNITLGGTPVQNIISASSTLITVVVGNGSSGDVVDNMGGGATASFSGFVFSPVPLPPVIIPESSLVISRGGSVILLGGSNGDSFQWLKDGAEIGGQTSRIFTATEPGTYTYKVTAGGTTRTSAPAVVSYEGELSANNFKISNIGASCQGSANGAIVIEALTPISSIATISGPGFSAKQYAFTDKLTIDKLTAGNYSICITLPGNAGFLQCFNSSISEPKDLGVYTAVVNKTNQVVLSLSGASSYSVAINGNTYTTTKNQLTLPLANGVNNIAVSTDRPCQGIINKVITIADRAIPFPNPFTNIVNVNLGEDNIPSATVVIYDTANKTVYSKNYSNQAGVLQIGVANLSSGLYFLKLTAGDKETIYKIIKK